MQNLQLLSIIIGAVVTALVGVAVYFLNQVLLFKNRIFWSDGPRDHAAGGETIGNIEFDGRNRMVTFSQRSFLLRVRGWSPIRNVVIHLEGIPDAVKVSPDIPFKISADGTGAEIKVSSINSGTYVFSATRLSERYSSLSVKGVEADNAIAVKRDELGRRFEPPLLWSIGKPQLIMWGGILAISRVAEWILSILKQP